MKKITFKKGVRRINFPILPDIEGESIKAIRRITEQYKLPKFSRIGYERTICTEKGYECDLTQVYIEK